MFVHFEEKNIYLNIHMDYFPLPNIYIKHLKYVKEFLLQNFIDKTQRNFTDNNICTLKTYTSPQYFLSKRNLSKQSI